MCVTHMCVCVYVCAKTDRQTDTQTDRQTHTSCTCVCVCATCVISIVSCHRVMVLKLRLRHAHLSFKRLKALSSFCRIRCFASHKDYQDSLQDLLREFNTQVIRALLLDKVDKVSKSRESKIRN